MLQNVLQPGAVERCAAAKVTEIMRNQIEAIALGRAVPSEVDNHGIFGLRLSGEIGERLGLSRERVRQIEAVALARLRAGATSSGAMASGPFDFDDAA